MAGAWQSQRQRLSQTRPQAIELGCCEDALTVLGIGSSVRVQVLGGPLMKQRSQASGTVWQWTGVWPIPARFNWRNAYVRCLMVMR